MYGVSIDFKQFYEEFGISISNPTDKGKDICRKYKLMIFLREHYVKHRNLYKKVFRENNAVARLLDSNDGFRSDNDKICCAAEQQADMETGKITSPYCYLESIQVIDILPKEAIPKFRKTIKKMMKKNQGDGYNYNFMEEASFDDFKKVHNSFFHFCAASFALKRNSKLGKYASSISIEMLSLSSSFVGVVCKFYINRDWKKKINDLFVKDREIQHYYCGMEELKVYQFRKIGKGHISGRDYKQIIIGVLLEEIKYRISKEFFKELDTVIFSMEQKTIAINVFETNIDGNSSEDFWKSIGVEARFCNYLKYQDACINPLHRNNLDLDYIYRINPGDKYDGRMVADDIGDRYIEYLSVVGLKDAIEEKITKISLWIQKCRYANLPIWMKLKARVDYEFMYAKRFASEFKSRGYLEPNDYCVVSSINIAQDAVDYIDKTVSSSKKLIEDTSLVVDSNVEAQNSTASYRIQRITLYTNLFSAIAALVAIIISLLSNQTKNGIISWLENAQIARYAIYVATSILLVGGIIKIAIELYWKINCIAIFRKK